MQCVNCRFENMPGVENCGRCGATLRLASLAIDVHPPRAGRWAKRWRNLPLARTRWKMAPVAFAAASWIPPLDLLARLVLPGWAQFHSGHPLLGRRLLGAWAACLALGLLFFGSALGSLFLGLALACHAASAIDVAFAATPRPVGRWLVAGALLAGLTLAVYWPILSIAGRFVDARVIRVNRPPLLAGDVLLFRPARAHPPLNRVMSSSSTCFRRQLAWRPAWICGCAARPLIACWPWGASTWRATRAACVLTDNQSRGGR